MRKKRVTKNKYEFSTDFTVGHHEDDEARGGRYLRSCAAAATPAATAYHPHHEIHPSYDPMDTEFDRYRHQQQPVDLGYNNR